MLGSYSGVVLGIAATVLSSNHTALTASVVTADGVPLAELPNLTGFYIGQGEPVVVLPLGLSYAIIGVRH